MLDRVYKTTRPDGKDEGIDLIEARTLGGRPVSYVRTYDAKSYKLERWTDQHGRMIKSSDPSGQQTNFHHDPEGRLISVDIAPGSGAGTTQLENYYDAVGNKYKVIDLSGGTSTTKHNGFGEAISATTPHGTTTSAYDAFGRQTSVTKPEGTYTTTYRGAAPALGKVSQIDGPGGYQETMAYGNGTSYGYAHEYGRLLDVTKRESTSAAVYYSTTRYNALGLVMDEIFEGRSDTTDDDVHVRHEYDSVFGSFELRTKLIHGGAQQTLLSEFGSINFSGNQIATTAKLAHGVERTVTNDARNGRILGILSEQGTTLLQSLSYTWDDNGNLLTREDDIANKTETFQYDTDSKNLNRLTKSTISGQSAVDYAYDDKGNLTSKGGSGTLGTYSGYRVTNATIKSQARYFEYDAAGHVDKVRDTNSSGAVLRDYDWSSFGQLKQVSQTSTPALETFVATGAYVPDNIPGIAPWETYQPSQATAVFDFDAAGSRSKQVLTRVHALGSEKRCTTRYLGSYEREDHETKPAGGSYALDRTLHRHALGNALLTAEKIGSSAALVRLAVILTDHIGSTDVIVRGEWNGSGWNLGSNQQQAERQSFDAWGQRRHQTAWSDLHPAYNSNRQTSAMNYDRGFTGHEMLDDFALVHMNGRIYDSELGRFLSPDPYVQVPEYSQNFNRYSYVLNNPLSLTDPSGQLIHGLKTAAHVAGFLEARAGARDYLAKHPDVAQVVTIVVGVVLMIVTGGAAAAGWSGLGSFSGLGLNGFQAAIVTGAGTGGFGAAASGGDFGDVLRGAAVAGAQAAITAGILHNLDVGAGFAESMGATERAVLHVAGHALVGGASNAAMGGKFQDGFLSGLVGALASQAGVYDVFGTSMGLPNVLGRTALAGIVGGTASAIGGGKFANGAFTAAFQHFLNREGGMTKDEEIAAVEAATGEKLSWLAKFFYKHETIANGAEHLANGAAGFSDGVLAGHGETLARAVHGPDMVWADENSKMYKTGVVVGVASTTVAGGAAGAARAGGLRNLGYYELGQKWLPRLAARPGRLTRWLSRTPVENGKIILKAAKGNWLKAALPDKIFAPMAPRALRTGPTPLSGGATISVGNGAANYFSE